MRLRRTVGPGPAGRISARAPGYLIRLDASELDVWQFEEYCREAGAGLRAGEWARVSDAAARALALWRGAPLLDVPAQSLCDQFAPRLEQSRVQVLEDRIEADLNLGRHEQVVAQVRELTAAHPLRERFHAQLMLALVRGGRQAEALEAYQDARRVLVEELGIEPGAELRALQERILAGSCELVVARVEPAPTLGSGLGPSPGEAAAVVPRQLPAAVRHFTGRLPEMDALTGLARETDAVGGTVVICAVDGMAGIGKTTLALHAAHRLAARFPDGQLFLDLHGYTQDYPPRTPDQALEWFLRALGVPPQRIPPDTEARAALYRQRLADTRTLIVLDNAADEAQVRPLLPGNPGCLVLITGRRRLKGLDDAQILALDVLPPVEAVTLLRAVAGPERVPVDDPVAAEIAELCGRLPLALRIAAALLRHRPAWPLAHLAGLLRDQQQRVSVLNDGERDLGAVFDLSYRNLTEAQQRLLRHLGLTPCADIDGYAAAALTDTDPATATRVLESLVDHNLLIAHAAGRYRLHDLIRAHSRSQCAPDTAEERQASLDRLFDYYRYTAARADNHIARYTRPRPADPTPTYVPVLADQDQARSWLRAERANLLACLEYATRTACDEHVIAMTAGISSLLLRTDGPWTVALTLHSAAADAAERLGDRREQASALTERGDVRRLVGDLSGAARDLETAIELSCDAGYRRGQAVALAQLGEVRRMRGDNAGAARDLQAALDLYRSLDDRRGEANALIELAGVRCLNCDYASAARDLQTALDLHRSVGDQSGQAIALVVLGVVERLTGDYPGAWRHLHAAIDVARAVGDRRGQAKALVELGDVRRLVGDLPGAARDFEVALGLHRGLGDQSGHAIAQAKLGDVQRLNGDYPSAARNVRVAVDLFHQMGSRGNEAWALNLYAAVFTAAGDHPQALTHFREALRLARETQQPDEEALALEGIGDCHLLTGDRETGTAHLVQALDLFQLLAMKPDADRIQSRLADSAGAARERHANSTPREHSGL